MNPLPPDEINKGSVLRKAVKNAALALGLSDTEISLVLGLQDQQWSAVDTLEPQSPAGQAGILFMRIVLELDYLYGGDRNWMAHYLRHPNKGTGGLPMEQIQTPGGLKVVLDSLEWFRLKQ